MRKPRDNGTAVAQQPAEAASDARSSEDLAASKVGAEVMEVTAEVTAEEHPAGAKEAEEPEELKPANEEAVVAVLAEEEAARPEEVKEEAKTTEQERLVVAAEDEPMVATEEEVVATAEEEEVTRPKEAEEEGQPDASLIRLSVHLHPDAVSVDTENKEI